MTTTYDPFHPRYFDEGDLREELARVYDLCHGCRLCFKFCTSFPTLFGYIDAHDDQDAARLSAAEQDQVVDECLQCKLCYINCPYTPGQHEWELDFPRLMMRAEQVLFRNRRRSAATRLTDAALGRTDLAGRVGSAVAPLANRIIGTPARRRDASWNRPWESPRSGCCRPINACASPPGSSVGVGLRSTPVAGEWACSPPARWSTPIPGSARTSSRSTSTTASDVTYRRVNSAAGPRCCTRATCQASPMRLGETCRCWRSGSEHAGVTARRRRSSYPNRPAAMYSRTTIRTTCRDLIPSWSPSTPSMQPST
ncbi:MAG: hypothetical protein R2789_06010 [Microthrixaceae bacterium]